LINQLIEIFGGFGLKTCSYDCGGAYPAAGAVSVAGEAAPLVRPWLESWVSKASE
jgi:hypothetical protein